MADRITSRSNIDRNKNEHKRIAAKVREGEKPLNRAERRAQQKGKSSS